jgi:hypothetical protein
VNLLFRGIETVEIKLNNNELYQQIKDDQAASIFGGGLLSGLGKTVRGVTDTLGQTVEQTTDSLDQTVEGLLGKPKQQNAPQTPTNQ